MATNRYFTQGSLSEQNLHEDIMIEALKIYGQDCYYLPRDTVNENHVLGADVPSRFNSTYKVEMYIENVEGFDGEGDLFSKFGVEIRDQVTLVVARKRWKHTVEYYDNEITTTRPLEGDLIYIPLSNSMFEITQVEHEQPFYQLKDLPTYKLRCEKFEYNDEQLNTGVDVIDSIEKTGFELKLTMVDSDGKGQFQIGELVNQTLGTGVVMNGEVTDWNDSDNMLSLAHIGSDDDSYHMFTAGGVITGAESGTIRTISSVSDELAQVDAQNNDFESQGISFLDFSETNPFGDPPSS